MINWKLLLGGSSKPKFDYDKIYSLAERVFESAREGAIKSTAVANHLKYYITGKIDLSDLAATKEEIEETQRMCSQALAVKRDGYNPRMVLACGNTDTVRDVEVSLEAYVPFTREISPEDPLVPVQKSIGLTLQRVRNLCNQKMGRTTSLSS